MIKLNAAQIAGVVRNIVMLGLGALSARGINIGIDESGIEIISTHLVELLTVLLGSAGVCYSSIAAPEKKAVNQNGRKSSKGWLLSERSNKTLSEIPPRFKQLLIHALHESPYDVCFYEGLRTIDAQKHNIAIGKSWTLNSKHLPQADGLSHAVDFYKVGLDGKADWNDWGAYETFARLVQKLAPLYDLEIVWGGDWKKKDGTHLELC